MRSTGRADGSQTSPSSETRPIDEYPLPPGPDGYPIVGNTLQLLSDPFGFYDDLATYGDVVRFGAMGNTFTALLHPEHVERVLLEGSDRFRRWGFTDVGLDFAPEGVLAADDEQWHRQRRILRPAFTIERIRSYADTMATFADRTASRWDDGAAIDLNEAFSTLSLEILAKTLFDLDLDDDTEAIARAVRLLNERSGPGRNVSMFLPEWIRTPADRRYERAIDEYRDRVDALVERRRAEESMREDLLSILLTAEGPDGRGLSAVEIRDNLATFLFAGHETTSLGLAYTFMLLSQHDDARARLQAECDERITDGVPGFEHVAELEYTEAVIREAMRLYPPVYILFRETRDAVVLGGYRIPEGTIVTLPQFFIHTDDRHYDRPDEFRPERWLDDVDELAGADGVVGVDGVVDDRSKRRGGNTEGNRPEYAYFPFGGGPRHCIGMRFAMLEMQLVVATIARTFDTTLLSDPDPNLTPGATLRPAENVRVRVDRR